MKNLINTLTKVTTTKIELNLKNTLQNGQAFNWEDKTNDRFIGIVGNMLLLLEYTDDLEIQYQILNKINKVEYSRHQPKLKSIDEQITEVMNVYLRLDHDLPSLMNQWKKDAYFNEVGTKIQGLRMIKQEPLECVISFIVSQNNNIKRIASNLLSIRRAFGTLLGTYEKVDYFRFPSLVQLKQANLIQLKEMGLGYRASYIIEFVRHLEELGGEQYLIDLIGKENDVILLKLLQFKGIGRKVADCIRLFSMECNSVVPVDTHVFQIYMNKYKKGSKKKVDAGCYGEVQDLFQEKFGEHAGWAHSYLFAAQLPLFKSELASKKLDEDQPLSSKLQKKDKLEIMEQFEEIKEVKTIKKKQKKIK